MKKARKGFTLIELLIVIVIIGILASMATLSSGRATTAADAMKIVNDLKAVRGAVMMFKLEHSTSTDLKLGAFNAESDDYLDHPLGNIIVAQSADTGHSTWYAGVLVPMSSDVSKKLGDLAKTQGLRGSKAFANPITTTIDDLYEGKTKNHKYVILKVFNEAQ